MIVPTVGRVVLYHPVAGFKGCPAGFGIPLPALVCRVWANDSINVGGFDANGEPFSATSVFLQQDDSPVPNGQHWAEWMPYQKQVAAGTIPPTLHATGSK